MANWRDTGRRSQRRAKRKKRARARRNEEAGRHSTTRVSPTGAAPGRQMHRFEHNFPEREAPTRGVHQNQRRTRNLDASAAGYRRRRVSQCVGRHPLGCVKRRLADSHLDRMSPLPAVGIHCKARVCESILLWGLAVAFAGTRGSGGRLDASSVSRSAPSLLVPRHPPATDTSAQVMCDTLD